jgi:hypothetical protein
MRAYSLRSLTRSTGSAPGKIGSTMRFACCRRVWCGNGGVPTCSASTAATTTNTGRTTRSTSSRPMAETRFRWTGRFVYGVAISSADSSMSTRPPEFANPTRRRATRRDRRQARASAASDGQPPRRILAHSPFLDLFSRTGGSFRPPQRPTGVASLPTKAGVRLLGASTSRARSCVRLRRWRASAWPRASPL